MKRLLQWLRDRWRLDDDLKEELEFHLQQRAQLNREAGLSDDEARAAARRQFGNRSLIHEDARAMYIPWFIESAWQDVRYAARSLSRNPGFAVAAIVTLALGIGANSAIFQVLDAIVLKPLPVREPHRLVRLQGYHDDNGNAFSYPLLREMAARQTTVEGIFASGLVGVKDAAVDGRAPVHPVSALVATGNYFRLLGTQPYRGRFFAEADDSPTSPPVAVISYAFWQRELGAQPDAVGRIVRINSVGATIVGVARREFQGERIGAPVDVWLPLSHAGQLSSPASLTASSIWLQPMARLRADVPVARAEAELSLLWDQLKTLSIQFRGVKKYHLALLPGEQGLGTLHTQYSRPLWLLMAIVALLALLTACNLANLLLARATARTREIAVRLAIGAGRRRVVRQLLTESLVLCCLAGGIGLVLAWLTAGRLVDLASAGEGWLLDLRVSWRIVGFTALVSLGAALIFGLAPALTATRGDVNPALQGRGHQGGGEASPRHYVPRTFVVAQVSLSFLLVAAASLLVRSFWNLTHQDFGFDPRGVLMAELEAEGRAFGPRWAQSADLVRERIRRMPGVVDAGLIGSGVLGQWSPTSVGPIALPDRVVPESAGVRLVPVSASYLETLRIRVLRGRPIQQQDGAQSTRVAVISETAARVIFGSEDPIGRLFAPGSEFPARFTLEVVGVMQDHVFGAPREPFQPLVFVPLAQLPPGGPPRLMLRVVNDREPWTAALQTALRESAPEFRLLRVRPLGELLSFATRQEHLLAWLSGAFAGLGLLLAGVGLYGVVACSTSRRTREIGILMALGAGPEEIRRSVLKESFVAVALGMAIGLAAAIAATRYLETLLFGVSRRDPASILVTSCLLLAVGMIAGYLPARRASRSDPLESLRHE
ncbi:MAG TPA: ABC transporter permease [Vicinamibacterales bacterium]|nr:ABC transporter permease [Vicinamibacterales bacterium]